MNAHSLLLTTPIRVTQLGATACWRRVTHRTVHSGQNTALALRPGSRVPLGRVRATSAVLNHLRVQTVRRGDYATDPADQGW